MLTLLEPEYAGHMGLSSPGVAHADCFQSPVFMAPDGPTPAWVLFGGMSDSPSAVEDQDIVSTVAPAISNNPIESALVCLR